MANEQTWLLEKQTPHEIEVQFGNNCIVTLPKIIDDYEEIYDDQLLFQKGLSYDQLLPFTNDPWWKNIRLAFMISFWVTILVMLTAACVISFMGHEMQCPTNVNTFPNIINNTSIIPTILSSGIALIGL